MSKNEKKDAPNGSTDKDHDDISKHPLDFGPWKEAFRESGDWISKHPYIIVGVVVGLFALPIVLHQLRLLASEIR